MDKINTFAHQGLSFVLALVKGTRIDPANIGIRIVFLIVIIILVSFLVDFLLARSVFGQNYRIFVAPGVILHELSHATLCLLTGAKISKISLFDKEGGSVEHSAPKIPLAGQVLISLAPFAFGVAAIFFLASALGLREIELAKVSFSFGSLLPFAKSIISPINFHDSRNWLILYLVLSIVVTMAPSKQDMKNIVLSFIILCMIFFLAFRFLHLGTLLHFLPAEKIFLLLSTVIVLLILALVLSIIVFMISKMIKR